MFRFTLILLFISIGLIDCEHVSNLERVNLFFEL